LGCGVGNCARRLLERPDRLVASRACTDTVARADVEGVWADGEVKLGDAEERGRSQEGDAKDAGADDSDGADGDDDDGDEREECEDGADGENKVVIRLAVKTCPGGRRAREAYGFARDTGIPSNPADPTDSTEEPLTAVFGFLRWGSSHGASVPLRPDLFFFSLIFSVYRVPLSVFVWFKVRVTGRLAHKRLRSSTGDGDDDNADDNGTKGSTKDSPEKSSQKPANSSRRETHRLVVVVIFFFLEMR